MSDEPSYPTANAKRFNLDVDLDADVPPYRDFAHTDRLDNFTVMEVAGKSRCHGMQLEGMAYPITPIGMHYLLIHYDIPMLDESTYRLKVDGLAKNPLALDIDNIRSRPNRSARWAEGVWNSTTPKNRTANSTLTWASV